MAFASTFLLSYNIVDSIGKLKQVNDRRESDIRGYDAIHAASGQVGQSHRIRHYGHLPKLSLCLTEGRRAVRAVPARGGGDVSVPNQWIALLSLFGEPVRHVTDPSTGNLARKKRL